LSVSTKTRVFFYVQHLLGIGHLRRAALLCRAMSLAGYDVAMAMGGMPVPNLDVGDSKIVQLPPLRIGDGGFNDLVDQAGGKVDEAWKTARWERLIAAFEAHAAHVLITEAFPFGRRQMRFELMPLLEAAARQDLPPLVVCSVRDLLKSRLKPGRAEETVDLITEYYDLVMVHGDPSFAELRETFPGADAFAAKIRYTGMVAPPKADAGRPASDMPAVLVSAGGGAVGERLFRTALEARPLSRFGSASWWLLVGPNFAEESLEELRRSAPDGVRIERYRKDFPALLESCAVSVSQSGYNTVADILQSGAAAVLVPFDLDGEDEQPRRAAKLAALGRVQSIVGDELTPESLADAIDRAADAPEVECTLDLCGAAHSVAVLRQAIEKRG
jgi:predicted glycosyltransferase